MKKILPLLILASSLGQVQAQENHKLLRVGIAGLTHGHVGWILGYKKNEVIEIVGIAEPNRDLAERMSKQYGFSMDLVYSSLDDMLDKKKPEAVTAFNSIYQHLEVVKACAPRGIHVMVEKPLTYRFDHALQMEALAKQYKIKLLTNYETTWYGSNHKAYEWVHTENAIGPIRKIVVHDGHPGPKEIGVGPDFLGWLTDPIQNGGGAMIDFGCYGANLITWMMKGERPVSVTAVTQQLKPDIYPKVDDEATAELMKRFYTNMLQRGMTPTAALRSAQNSIRQEPQWRAPYYWAAFTMQGEYRQVIKPTPPKARPPYVLIFAGAVLLLLVGVVWQYRRLRRMRTA